MNRLSQVSRWVLLIASILSCALAGAWPAVAQDSRVVQVWPDQGVGLVAGRLDGRSAHTDLGVLPFGTYQADDGAVQGRSYLHFPLDVFPPGTDIQRVTLYVYVDGAAGTGDGTFGAYRVTESWQPGDAWSPDPATWPSLLATPIAVAEASLADLTGDLPQPTPGGGTSSLPMPTPTSQFTPTPTPSTSVLPTPGESTVATPTPTATAEPAATSAPGATDYDQMVPLEQANGTWLTWDVTMLVQGWLEGDVADRGLALASAPEPGAGALLVARWADTEDILMQPYLIAEFDVRPVTPTPAPVLPVAGGGRADVFGWVLAGGALLLLVGLLVRQASSSREEQIG